MRGHGRHDTCVFEPIYQQLSDHKDSAAATLERAMGEDGGSLDYWLTSFQGRVAELFKSTSSGSRLHILRKCPYKWFTFPGGEWLQTWPVIRGLGGFNISEFKSAPHESEDLYLMSPVIKDPRHLRAATSGLPASCAWFTFSLEVKNLIIWTTKSVLFFPSWQRPCVKSHQLFSSASLHAWHCSSPNSRIYSGARSSLSLSC